MTKRRDRNRKELAMLAPHEILESLTTAAHGEIAPAVLEAAAIEIWEIVAKHDAA